jgi:hypothetical protein
MCDDSDVKVGEALFAEGFSFCLNVRRKVVSYEQGAVPSLGRAVCRGDWAGVQAAGKEHFRDGLRTSQLVSNVLASARVSASLEYNGKCGPDVPVPDFPRAREPLKPYAQNPVNTFRSMFLVDGRIVVSQKSNGTIRIIEAGVQTDILDVRIGHLSFQKISDPEEALGMVLGAPEVQSFIRARGIGQPVDMYTTPLYLLPGINRSPAGMRSISGELNNVTLAEALDYILKTFPGFLLYQNCQSPDGQRLVYFALFPAPGRIWVWENGQTLVK